MSVDGITRVLAIKGFSAATMEVGRKRIDIWLERDGSEFRCARCGQLHLVALGTDADKWEAWLETQAGE
ncbi:MAG: hypothetical protein ACYTKD_29585 [Planctomycetota bacterium]|jgi:hypothetical protein